MPPTIPNYRSDLVIHASCPRCTAAHQIAAPASPVQVHCYRCGAIFLAVEGNGARDQIFRDRRTPRARKVRP